MGIYNVLHWRRSLRHPLLYTRERPRKVRSGCACVSGMKPGKPLRGGGAWRTEDGGQSWSIEPSSQSVWGIGVGDIAVGDTEHAIGGGPNSIITRLP